jgi:hypothetical protein
VIATARKHVRFLVAAALGAGALLLAAPVASAQGDLLGGTCDGDLSQPFLRWLDVASYALAPDGGFEQSASGWTLAGGARVVSGNEPWHVNDPDDSLSLSLPAGSQATSPDICVTLAHPTVRFFVRHSGLLGLGLLSVDAEVHAAGADLRVPVGVVTAGSSFTPSLPLALLANLTAPLGGDSASVRLRFTALDGGFGIDDVYIDPFKVP